MFNACKDPRSYGICIGKDYTQAIICLPNAQIMYIINISKTMLYVGEKKMVNYAN